MIKKWRVAILMLVFSSLVYACGTLSTPRSPTAVGSRTSEPSQPLTAPNFACSIASAKYRLHRVSIGEANALIADSGLNARIPKDLMGLAITAGGGLYGERRGVVFDLGADVDREIVAVIFSSADAPACSGAPSRDAAYVTEQRIAVYPFQFSNAVQYIAWFKPNGSLAVELKVNWVPNKEPSRGDQLSVVTKWITAFYEANRP